MKKQILILFSELFLASSSFATLWQVGAGRTYTLPSQVSTLVQDGDSVDIDAGIYSADVARWSANNLLLRGINGIAQLPSNGLTYGNKAIWVIAGNNTTVEYVEFSEATSTDNNGAGIRQEGMNLTVSHCYFHDNEDGILAGTVNPSNIKIEFTEFGHNGYGDGYSHNLYINNIDTLIFQYNYTHDCNVGHELKSRAHVNYILYNRISDEATGTASRSIDLPNGGTAFVIGNVIEQGPNSQNSNIIGYGLEGLTNPPPHDFYAVNNTIVNDRSAGSFFSFATATNLFKGYNNILAGNGSFVLGSFPATVDTASNLVITNINAVGFANAAGFDYHILSSASSAINMGTNPGTAGSFSLTPILEYNHPSNIIQRCIQDTIDIGAYEYCMSNNISEHNIQNTISLYPNPSCGKIQIDKGDNAALQITLYNLYGEEVSVHTLTDEITLLELNSLTSDCYFYFIRGDEIYFSGKIILMK